MPFTCAGQAMSGRLAALALRSNNARSIFRNLLFILAAMALAACELTPEPVAAPAVSRIKSIGVISMIGHQLEFEQLSLTSVTTGTFVYPAEEFAIDRFTADLIATNLQGRFDVRPVQYNRADFGFEEIVLADDAGLLDSGQPIGAVIKAKVSPNDLDAYIVVTRGGGPVKTGSYLTQNGVGVLRQHRLFYHDYFVHAIYHLTIVDGQTGKVIGRTPSPIFGSVEADESYWPFDSENVSIDQARRVADTTKGAIGDSMPGALKALNLLPQ